MKRPSLINFSVIIPTRNRCRQVCRKILLLTKQRFPQDRYEVIVVDNHSTDDTLNELKKLKANIPNLLILTENRLGMSYAKNKGVSRARYEYLVFSDDDVLFPPSYLQSLAKAWEKHPQAAIIGGPLEAVLTDRRKTSTDETLIKKHPWVFGHLDMGKSEHLLINEEALNGGNVSINRSSLSKYDLPTLFNENFGRTITEQYRIGGEDYELCQRLMLRKQQVWYVPALKVKHLVSSDRFTDRYLSLCYFRHGLDLFLMDDLLKEQYGKVYVSFWDRVVQSWKDTLKYRNLNFFRYFCGDKYKRLVLFHYFLNKHFLKPTVTKTN